MAGRKIDPQVRDIIISRLKKEGVTVPAMSKEYGISSQTIYSWIGSKSTIAPGVAEINKLKRENNELKQIIGALALNMERGKKNL